MKVVLRRPEIYNNTEELFRSGILSEYKVYDAFVDEKEEETLIVHVYEGVKLSKYYISFIEYIVVDDYPWTQEYLSRLEEEYNKRDWLWI